MTTGSWLDNDGKFRQYGTSKAVAEIGGDYLSYGEVRQIELTIDLTTLTASPLVQSYTTFFPASNTQLFVERIEMDVEVAAATGTAINVGTGYMTAGTLTNPPAVTAISNTAFINGEVTATITPAGKKVIYTAGTTHAGGYIGSTSGDQTHKNYITAMTTDSTAFTAGKIKLRIFYRGFGNITQ